MFDIKLPPEVLRWLALFGAGAGIAVLKTLGDHSRRTPLELTIGAIFGGVGSLLVGLAFDGHWLVYLFCGVAAVVTENVAIGLSNASKQFAANPIEVFTKLWNLVMPTFGKKE